MNGALAPSLEALGLPEPVGTSSLSGGCIHNVERVDLAGAGRVVCKIADGERGASMLRSERVSLDALAATDTVMTPSVHGLHEHDGTSVLVMEFLEPGVEGDWAALGQALAAMHACDQGALWGFHQDTWLGGFLQPNTSSGHWHEFMRHRRLEPQVRLAVNSGRLPDRLAERCRKVLAGLESTVPPPKHFSLLHGDLWSGNFCVTAERAVAVLDPAVWIGDAWADIAMAKLFGSVPEAMFSAWSRAWDDHDAADERIALHQLYHMLNHLNLFGDGYLGGVEAALSSLP